MTDAEDDVKEEDTTPTWRSAITLALYTWANVFIITFSMRAVAADDFMGVFVTDILYGFLSFSVFKKMQEADSKIEMVAYTAAVAFGSQFAMHFYKLYVL